MRKTLLLTLILIIFPVLILSQNYENAGMDYSKALFENKTASARIRALKNYIQTYTDTSNKFVRLAHYQLALNYFEIKDYANAISTGQKTLTLGSLGTGEEARLNLVLANSYGIKSFSGYNKEKALSYTNKAIRLGKEAKDDNVVSTANKLKSSLTGPPPKKLTPEQKIRKFYTEDDFRGVVNYYGTLDNSLKNSEDISKLYGYSLFKLKNYNSALSHFLTLYKTHKKGTYAKYIADSYAKKASSRNTSYYDKSASYYLEASILYEKEGSQGNRKIAAGKAKEMLENKYGYKSKYTAYKKQLEQQKSSSQKYASQIRVLKKKIRDFKRYMRKTYRDIEAPQYEYDKLQKMESQLKSLESGGPSNGGSNKSGEELLKLRKKIDNEYNTLLGQARDKFKEK